MNAEVTDYFIMRNGNTHGPCTVDELRNYLTYGSMHPADLVSPAGHSDWRPASSVLATYDPEEERGTSPSDPWLDRMGYLCKRVWSALAVKQSEGAQPKIRRRVVRFRDWDKVPVNVRSTRVLWMLISGFLMNPPRLWATSALVFSSRVFRPAADEGGYLKTWSKNVETVCAVLIVFQALLWSILAVVLSDKLAPVMAIMGHIAGDTYREWKAQS